MFVASAMLAAMMISVAGCSGTPPANEQAAPLRAPASSTSNASDQASNTDPQKLTPERIMQLQREGYTLVNRNGEPYFCRSEKKTGSRLARETICMTEPEIVALREQTQRGLGRVMRERAPPQGN
jgi:hypothetical protein